MAELGDFDDAQTSEILPAEREKASFNVEEMTDFLNGGDKYTAKRRWIFKAHKDVEPYTHAEHSREQVITDSIKHFFDVHDPHFERGYKPKDQDISFMSESMMFHSPAVANNFGVFAATVRGQCSEEQCGWWLDATQRGKIIGCYSQTELGHGSNVRGLMTTATYDAATEEWVLHTPNVRALKWWCTAMPLCTHAAVFCQLNCGGKWQGGHWFMVQLRGEDLKLLPGIDVGDIGTQLGDNAVPVGYLRMTNVRVPRQYLMEKLQHVTPSGEYVRGPPAKKGAKKEGEPAVPKKAPADPKLMQALRYVAMMKTRINLASQAAGALAKACVITTRYSCVRKQGFKGQGGSSHLAAENQIIDYGVQRQRVVHRTAQAYAMKVATRWLINRRHQVEQADPAQGGRKSIDVSDLPELHATGAGMKAFCTIWAADGIEDLRRACGGHGYLMSSGIAALEADFKGKNVTSEGDFVLLALQTARSLMKSYDAAKAGKEAEGPLEAELAFLKDGAFNAVRDGREAVGCAATGKAAMREVPFLLALLKYRRLAAIARAGEALAAARAKGDPEGAWNRCAPVLYGATRCHLSCFIFEKFVASLDECEDEPCRLVLERLARVFALADVNSGEGWLGLLGYDEANWAGELLEEACAELRPDLVAITDAFDFPDRVLNSALGRADGKVYESLFAEARRSALNVGADGEPVEVPSFVQAMDYRLDKSILAWRNGLPPTAQAKL